jgi:hypothetical protein
MDKLPIDRIEHVNFHRISLGNVEIQHNRPLRWMIARQLAHHVDMRRRCREALA